MFNLKIGTIKFILLRRVQLKNWLKYQTNEQHFTVTNTFNLYQALYHPNPVFKLNQEQAFLFLLNLVWTNVEPM